jgi:hypothetical protein
VPGCDMQLFKWSQGFGKAKNRVGMHRPSKKKVEKTDTTTEDGDEVAVDTGITGE